TKRKAARAATPRAPSFDTIGFYGATVPDAVALYEAMAPAFIAPAGPDMPLAIVQLEDPALEACDRAIADAVTAGATRFARAGHRLRRAPSPESWATLFEVQVRVMQYE